MGGTNEAKVGLWPLPDLAVLKGGSGSGRKRVGLWWQNGAAGRGGFRRRNGGSPSIEDLPWQVFTACAEAGDRCVRTVRIVERDPRVDETHTA